MLSKPVCRWIVLCVSMLACALAPAGATVTELKPPDSAALIARHEYAVVQTTSTAPPLAAMTEGERVVARVMVRHDLLRGLMAGCAKLFPDQAQGYQQATEDWRAARHSALNDAARLMLTRSSRDDAREVSQLVEAEKKALQLWQVQQLGISLQRAPLATDCARMAKHLPEAS